ncbi:hypothetical protein CVS40_0695 [Lucilia cuprina]|nr:hypothetical protein CVS40_0695 [Lucilia cuprina]
MPTGDLTTTMQPSTTTPYQITPVQNVKVRALWLILGRCRKFYRCIPTKEGYERHEFNCAKNTRHGMKRNKRVDHRDKCRTLSRTNREPEPETTTYGISEYNDNRKVFIYHNVFDY